MEIIEYTIKKVTGFSEFADYYAIIDTATDYYKYIVQILTDTEEEDSTLVRCFRNIDDDISHFGDLWYNTKDIEDIESLCYDAAIRMDEKLEQMHQHAHTLLHSMQREEEEVSEE